MILDLDMDQVRQARFQTPLLRDEKIRSHHP